MRVQLKVWFFTIGKSLFVIQVYVQRFLYINVYRLYAICVRSRCRNRQGFNFINKSNFTCVVLVQARRIYLYLYATGWTLFFTLDISGYGKGNNRERQFITNGVANGLLPCSEWEISQIQFKGSLFGKSSVQIIIA